MKTSRRQKPEINSGSMADIAFLLLIFFLVTAMIPKDKGISRKLPSICPPGQNCNAEVKQRNTLEILVNGQDELMVENEKLDISKLKGKVKLFLDNNGNKTCDYCSGTSEETLSEHPDKAVISLKNDMQTTYDFYIQIQDEITKAYFELRSNYAKSKFNKNPKELTEDELKEVRKAYPILLSEVEN
ncbi:MAG: biopolymer transporter ExbD [Bacteroidota bacterium]